MIGDPMDDRWREPRRLAGWEPDLAREILLGLAEQGGEDLELAQTSELLAKVFAVTRAWDLARDAYETAAGAWGEFDPVRAEALRAVASRLPLMPFGTDRDGLLAEISVIRHSFQGGPSPILERAVNEIRRCLTPRPITGRLEAAFGLAPEELALVMGAVTPILNPDAAPLLPLADWLEVIAASTGVMPDPTRLLALGIVRATPELVPHPALASRLMGRTALEHPAGARLVPVEALGGATDDAEDLSRALVSGYGIAVIVGPASSGRRTAAARLARQRGRKLFGVRVVSGASADSVVEAALEARLHDGLLAVDLDDWGQRGVDAELLNRLAPIVCVTREEPEIPPDLRAFTMYPIGVSSPQ